MTLTPHPSEKVPTWDVGTGPDAYLRRELNRAEARLRRSRRLTAAATVLALAAGGGWFADRWADRVPGYVEQDVRAVLAGWADLLEQAAIGKPPSDAQLGAAGVTPGADSRRVLGYMADIRKEFEAESLAIAYRIDDIYSAGSTLFVRASMRIGDGARPDDLPSDGEPRELTFLRTGGEPSDGPADPEAASDSSAAPLGSAGTPEGATARPPATAAQPGPVHHVRLIDDSTGQHCCMPIFP